MIDKRTEASVNYAEILAKGLNATAKAEEPAAAAVSWNATPSINMAAAMASLMMGSAAKEESAPALSTDAIRDAANFAENKAQLKNMLSEAQRVVASMQPGPEKTQAQGVIAAASGASPANIRAVLDALRDMIDQAKSKEVSSENILTAREQAEAEREAKIRQLREQINSAYDEFEKKGYSTKEEREENEKRQQDLDERLKEIQHLSSLKNRTPEQEARLASLREEYKEALQADKDIHDAQLNRIEAEAVRRDDKPAVERVERTREAVDESFKAQYEQLTEFEGRVNARSSLVSAGTPDTKSSAVNVSTNPLGVIYNEDPTLNAGSTLIALNTPKVNDGKEGQQVSEPNAPGW